MASPHRRDVPQQPTTISVIVPVLNEATTIDQTLEALAALPAPIEVIVVDGGSGDGTVERATRQGVRIIGGPVGRGSQMQAGAAAATGDVLWFLHADTLPPPDALKQIAEALRDPGTVGGNFSIRFAGDFAAARFLTWLYRHLSSIGLRYGDSAYFVRRSAYFEVGGFRPFPIFEDLDLMRRLRRRRRFVRVPATVVTSSRRFEGRSFARTFAWWSVLQLMYWLGAPPTLLGRLYRHVREPGTRRRWRWRPPPRAAEPRVTAAGRPA